MAVLITSAIGCGCYRKHFAAKPVTAPVYTRCVPTCAPSCNTCNPCGSSGGEVTYGYGGTSSTTYMPATSGDTLPMMAPGGSGS